MDKQTMAKIGDFIEIIEMDGEPQYTGKQGEVISINEGLVAGELQIWGTWGGCCLLEGTDKYKVLKTGQGGN